MALQPLPAFPGSSSYTYAIVLDNGADEEGSPVTFRFDWNQRTSGWYFSIYDANGDGVIIGERINAMATWAFSGRMPPGVLIALGSDGYQQVDLGTALQLVYVPIADLPEASANLRMTLGP